MAIASEELGQIRSTALGQRERHVRPILSLAPIIVQKNYSIKLIGAMIKA